MEKIAKPCAAPLVDMNFYKKARKLALGALNNPSDYVCTKSFALCCTS